MVDVTVVEVAPRDGLQNESTPVSTEDKVTLIRRSVAAGLKRIEATSFVHPRRVPQMADAEAVMAAVPRIEGVSYIGLVLNRRGLDRALAAGVDEINAVVVTTESFAERNQGMSVDATVDMAAEVVTLARAAGGATSVTVSTAFGCPYEGEVPLDKVLTLVERVTAAEPDEIAFGDTIGVGVPAQVREIVRGARDVAPGVRLRMHFHNTRNTGYANALAAVDAGVTVLDASTGGVGRLPVRARRDRQHRDRGPAVRPAPVRPPHRRRPPRGRRHRRLARLGPRRPRPRPARPRRLLPPTA
jgi:hydroxymethylglutaryl-CoA lyase